MRIFVILEKGRLGQEPFGCFALDAPGCITTGSSIEATLQNMQEALELYWEGEELPSHFLSDKEVLAKHPLEEGEFLTSVNVRVAEAA